MAELTYILVLVIGILSLVTNGVLLLILLKDPLQFFKVSTIYFIISLTVADLVTGANACFLGIHELVYTFPADYQKVLLSLFWITTQASFLTLLAMSVERFLAVKYPFYSRSWITKKRVWLCIALIWLISVTFGGLILLPDPKPLYAQFSIFTEFCISVLLFAILHAYILHGVRKSRMSLRARGKPNKTNGDSYKMQRVSSPSRTDYQVSVSPENEIANNEVEQSYYPSQSTTINSKGKSENGEAKTDGASQHGNKCPVQNIRGRVESGKEIDACDSSLDNGRLQLIDPKKSTVKRHKTRDKQEKKLTVVVLLLVGVLCLTVLPYLLASQIFVGYLIFSAHPPPPGLLKFKNIYFPIELLNFAVNPLIYAWRFPQFRRSLKYLFTFHKARRT